MDASLPPSRLPSSPLVKLAQTMPALRRLRETMDGGEKTLTDFYFGQPTAHTSMYRSDRGTKEKINDADMPPFARAFGLMHKELRALPRMLPQLDMEALPPGILRKSQELKADVALYRQMKARGEDVASINAAVVKTFTAIAEAFDRLGSAPLAVKLPATRDQSARTIKLRNAGALGQFLYALSLGGTGIVNEDMMPPALGEAIMRTIGIDGNILISIDNMLRPVKDTAFQKAYQGAAARCFESTVAVLRDPECLHALQMYHMLTQSTDMRACLKGLLALSGVDHPDPAGLRTPLECALAVAALSKRCGDMQPLLPLAMECAQKQGVQLQLAHGKYLIAATDRRPRAKLSPTVIATALQSLAAMAPAAGDTIAAYQAGLIRDFLAREQAMPLGRG